MPHFEAQFWTDFWPNLAATLAGIVLGLPLGFWINRHAVGLGQQAQRREDRNRIAGCLGILRASVAHNLERLRALESTIDLESTLADTGLDVSTWVALQAELTSELSDAHLRQALAGFFSRLSRLLSLNDRMLDQLLASNRNTLGGTNARRALLEAIDPLVKLLLQEGHALLTEMDGEVAQLAT